MQFFYYLKLLTARFTKHPVAFGLYTYVYKGGADLPPIHFGEESPF